MNKLKNLMKKEKYLFIALAITTLLFVGMMLPYWLNNLPLEYGGDLKPTYFPYYQEFRDLIRSFVNGEGLPFYSWELFLGNNFWASKSFYILGDPYYYVSLLFDTHFYNVFMIQTFLKMIVSTASFYCLARSFGYRGYSAVITSVLYSMSSWIMFFLGQPMFISFYSFAPLFFLGFEIYLKQNKVSLFVVVTALLLFVNYYLFFSMCLLAPFYFIARYYTIHKSFKGIVRSTLKIIGAYIVGIMTTMVLILPSFFYILQNDRVGAFYISYWFDQLEVVFHAIQSMLVPSQQIIYKDYNVFETGAHYSREVCLWAGSITALLVPQFLSDKDKFFKRAMMGLYAIMLLFMFIPSLSMIMQGFSTPSFRWLYLFIIVNLLVSGRYLNQLEKLNRKNLLITMICFSLLAALNVVIFLAMKGSLHLVSENIEMLYLGCTAAIVLITFGVVLLKRFKYALLLILLISIVEVGFYNIKLIGFDRKNENSTWEFIERATTVLESHPGELNAHLSGFDDSNYTSLYRVFVPHESLYWTYSHNHNLHYDLMGTMTYDSTYAPSFDDMKLIAPQVKAFNSDWIFNILDGDILNFINVKYAVVMSEDELPHDNFELLQSDYRGSLLIYENLDYRSVGNTYTQVMTYDEYLENGETTQRLLDTVIVHNEDLDIVQGAIGDEVIELKNIDFHNNYFYGNIETTEDGFMVLSIPYDAGWNLVINGQSIDYFQVNGGMIGFVVQGGYNDIVMHFTPVGFSEGLLISGLGIVLTCAIIFIEYGKKRKVR